MEVRAYPEAFINNTNDISISGTKNAILNPEILSKYQDELLDNKNGCIFKIVNNDTDNFICVEDYVVCKEFTAPEGVIFLPDDIYDNMLLSPDVNSKIEIELFIPPQATKIKLKPSDEDIFTTDIKQELEMIITNNYKFLKIDDIIHIGSSYVVVTELEPYFICMVNDTDLNVEFEPPEKSNVETNSNDLKHEDMFNNTLSQTSGYQVNIDNDNLLESNSDEEFKPLLRTELRNKRIAFFNKQ